MTYVPWSGHVLGILPLTAGSIFISISAFRYAGDLHSSDHLSTLLLLAAGVSLQMFSLLGFMIVGSGRKKVISFYSSLIVLVLLLSAGLGCTLLVRDSLSEGYRNYFTELVERTRNGDRASLIEVIRFQTRQHCCGMWNSSDWNKPDYNYETLRSCALVAKELKEQPHKVTGCYVQVFVRQKRFAFVIVVVGVVGALVQAIMTKHTRSNLLF